METEPKQQLTDKNSSPKLPGLYVGNKRIIIGSWDDVRRILRRGGQIPKSWIADDSRNLSQQNEK